MVRCPPGSGHELGAGAVRPSSRTAFAPVTAMSLVRLSISLFGVVAVVAATLAGATIWLLLTDPVTVADAVNEGDISPVVRELASLLYSALRGVLKYL